MKHFHRTLLIDCDPQSNSTSGVGFARGEDRLNTYDLLMGAAAAADALQPTEVETLWAIPAHKNLIGANIELVSAERLDGRHSQVELGTLNVDSHGSAGRGGIRLVTSGKRMPG